MAQSLRVETYLPKHVVDEIDRVSDNRSEYIREAVVASLDDEKVTEQ